MMPQLTVKFLPGDKIRVGDITGHVSLLYVSWPNKCRYEITYWHEGRKVEVICDEYELKGEA